MIDNCYALFSTNKEQPHERRKETDEENVKASQEDANEKRRQVLTQMGVSQPHAHRAPRITRKVDLMGNQCAS